MSISSALANALTGLTAVSRQADVVSSNVANAQTEGYGVRTVELASKSVGRTGSGVTVAGINRNYDPVLTGERRFADGKVALEQTRVDYHSSYSAAMGQVDDPGSIAGRVTGLETSLIEAASRPESESRLADVLNAAVSLANQINYAADELSAQRIQAEKDIQISVNFLQDALNKVVDLNVAIQENKTAGYDVNALLDQRQILVDQISEIVPVKEVPREGDMISLYTPGGSILVESQAATIEFTSVPTITPDMNIGSGMLSGLTINGQPVVLDTDKGAIAGGKLSALFELRDETIPKHQEQLDAMARDLIERFETTTADPTLGAGDPGLFTDGGSALDVTNEIGLANRISVNDLINPDEGGDLWRIRDGLGALAEGNQGNSAILSSLKDALTEPRVTSSGGFISNERSALALAADLYSLTETSLLSSQTDLAFSSARQEAFLTQELAQGVDSDQEMQKLLTIEQNYSANAKVVDTIQTLIDQLMGII